MNSPNSRLAAFLRRESESASDLVIGAIKEQYGFNLGYLRAAGLLPSNANTVQPDELAAHLRE